MCIDDADDMWFCYVQLYVMCDILYTASDVYVAELFIVDTDISENLLVILTVGHIRPVPYLVNIWMGIRYYITSKSPYMLVVT